MCVCVCVCVCVCACIHFHVVYTVYTRASALRTHPRRQTLKPHVIHKFISAYTNSYQHTHIHISIHTFISSYPHPTSTSTECIVPRGEFNDYIQNLHPACADDSIYNSNPTCSEAHADSLPCRTCSQAPCRTCSEAPCRLITLESRTLCSHVTFLAHFREVHHG